MSNSPYHIDWDQYQKTIDEILKKIADTQRSIGVSGITLDPSTVPVSVTGQSLPQGRVTVGSAVDLTRLIGERLGRIVHYDFIGDSWTVEPKDFQDGFRFANWVIGKPDLLELLAASGGDEAEESRRLREWFFGPEEALKEPIVERGTCSMHEWHTVTLFHTPQERCKWCDVKRSEVEAKG